ncbi:hypothetical protein MA16_Dca005106 [Dendrobium catenatum]|uniref:Uncharacterized protein n=1 Tax=Dendrobium catenatum TaxID=906689 RepID=A0A2I0VLD3_9ASPA|nr:hypothetical protein MA16_Dca005106 [Dendrobium catenatum]
MVDFWILEDETTPELDLQDLENEIYKEDAIPVVEEQNISFNQPGHCDLENEGDVVEIIGLDQSVAFEFEHFGEARHGDSNYIDRFDDANLGDL